MRRPNQISDASSGPSAVLLLAADASSTGGIERSVRAMVEALRARYGPGSVGLLTVWHSAKPSPSCQVFHTGQLRADGQTQPVRRSEQLRFAADALIAARRWRHRRLVIVAAHPHFAAVAWLASRVSGAPYAVWCYGKEAWTRPSWSRRRALGRAGVVLAISDFTARRVKAAVPSANVEVVHLGLSPGQRLPEGPSKRGQLVLSVARLIPGDAYKGVDALISAFAGVTGRVPGAELVIVGDGPDRPRLEAIAAMFDVHERVRFAGRVDDDELASLYAKAAVFALPGRTQLGRCPEGEGFGLVFLEAAGAGAPVVAGRGGGTPDAVIDQVTGLLVDSDDPAAVTDAVARLLEDPALARRLGEAGRRRVRGHFSHEAFADRLTTVVDRLAGTERAPEPDPPTCAA